MRCATTNSLERAWVLPLDLPLHEEEMPFERERSAACTMCINLGCNRRRSCWRIRPEIHFLASGASLPAVHSTRRLFTVPLVSSPSILHMTSLLKDYNAPRTFTRRTVKFSISENHTSISESVQKSGEDDSSPRAEPGNRRKYRL